MKLRCFGAFWILSTVRLSMRPWNPKLKIKKTQIDKTGSTFRKIHSRVVPKKRDPRNLGCSQSPRKKRDPQKNPCGRDPREFPIGPQGPPTKIPEKWCKHFENAKQATWARKEQWRKPFFVMETKNKKPFFGRQDRGWNQEKRKSFCAKKLGNPRESLQLRFKTGICFKLKQFGESKGELWYNCWNSKRDQTFASDNN